MECHLRRTIFFLLILFSEISVAQFQTSEFFAAGLDSSINSVKALFPSVRFLEKEVSGLKEYYFNDKIDSVSFKVGFFFKPDGKMEAKAISNLGTDAKSGEGFLHLFKDYTIKQFGERFESRQVAGTDIYVWYYGFNRIIMLTRKERQAALTITIKKELPTK
jgi:hypothetical protein